MNDFHNITNDTALDILKAAWRILKRHYEVLLGTSLLILLVAAAMSMFSYIRVLASIPIIFLTLGQMFIIRKLIEGQVTKFSDVFKVFENQRLMTSILPLAISGVGINLMQEGIAKVLDGGIFAGFFATMLNLTLTLIWVALTAFSAPLIAFKEKTLVQSIELNLRATTANWRALLIFAFYLLGIIVCSAICFLLPLFFIALPILFVSGYLTYLCLFENLDAAALAVRFSEDQVDKSDSGPRLSR